MFNVGEIEVRRIEESLGHGFQPNVLLPDWNARDIEPHLPWLAPTYYDPKGSLLYPCHFAGPHIGRIAERAGGFAYLPGRG